MTGTVLRSLAGVATITAMGAIALRTWECERVLSHARHRNKVRAAGPDHMRNPPDDWDMVDQQADESFPASDPPANY